MPHSLAPIHIVHDTNTTARGPLASTLTMQIQCDGGGSCVVALHERSQYDQEMTANCFEADSASKSKKLTMVSRICSLYVSITPQVANNFQSGLQTASGLLKN